MAPRDRRSAKVPARFLSEGDEGEGWMIVAVYGTPHRTGRRQTKACVGAAYCPELLGTSNRTEVLCCGTLCRSGLPCTAGPSATLHAGHCYPLALDSNSCLEPATGLYGPNNLCTTLHVPGLSVYALRSVPYYGRSCARRGRGWTNKACVSAVED